MWDKKSVPKVPTSQRKKWLEILQHSDAPSETGLEPSPENPYIIVDTNVLLSAILYGGVPSHIVEHVFAEARFITSDYIIDELLRNIQKRRPKSPRRWLVALRQGLAEYSKVQTVDVTKPSRDIKDDPIVALAIEYGAVIVTGDKDLLEYPHAKPPIISTSEYAELFME